MTDLDVATAADLAREQAALFARSDDDRERIAAEAVARAWAHRGRFDSARGSLAAWMFGVVRNVAREHGRAALRDRLLSYRLFQFRPLRVQAEMETEFVERERVRAAFVRLTNREQQVLYLRFWRDLPYADIARSTHLSEATCRQVSRRAIGKMGRFLR